MVTRRVVDEIAGGTSDAGVAALVTAVTGRDTRGGASEDERSHALQLVRTPPAD